MHVMLPSTVGHDYYGSSIELEPVARHIKTPRHFGTTLILSKLA